MRRAGVALVGAIAAIGVVVTMYPTQAQTIAQTPMATTAVPHVGIIVKDIDETIRRFQNIFGITISKPQDVGPLVFRGTPPPGAASSRLKVAAFKIGNMGFEIVQPVAGPSPHREFLDKFGQGLQHVAFEVKNAQKSVNYLVSKGGTWTTANNVDMQGVLGFSAEVREPNAPTAVPQATPVVAQTPLSKAIISHIGIVVPDVDKASRTFSEVFGVPVQRVQSATLTLPEGTPPNAERPKVRFTNLIVGNMRLELVQPAGGLGAHQAHLARYGMSLQHIGFEIQEPKIGIDFLVRQGGTHTSAPSVNMRDILGFAAELLPAP
jgi:methylmalonyl-CoA/ethylmalonyl-CoA epimerase